MTITEKEPVMEGKIPKEDKTSADGGVSEKDETSSEDEEEAKTEKKKKKKTTKAFEGQMFRFEKSRSLLI